MTSLSIQHNFTAEQIAGLTALALECRNYTVVMDRILMTDYILQMRKSGSCMAKKPLKNCMQQFIKTTSKMMVTSVFQAIIYF